MSTKLTQEQQDALDEAFEALQPFYDPGDDGDSVRLALNAIAGILGEKARVKVDADDGLKGVLSALSADEELRDAVEQLYETAGEGAYGDGLSKKGADKINDLVQEIEEPLMAVIKRTPPKSRTRKNVRAVKARSKKP